MDSEADRGSQPEALPEDELSGESGGCHVRPACPACGGVLIEIRAKLQCTLCHTICETCCEGGPG